MKQSELYLLRQDYLTRNYTYQYVHHSEFNFDILDNIMYVKRSGRGSNKTYNDCIIMFDTETSRKKLKNAKQFKILPSNLTTRENHIVAWTISIRAFHLNICTLWGHRPSTLVTTMDKIHDHLKGEITIMYAHNMPYDYTFLRQFLHKEFGKPKQQLNIKSHYPLYIRFNNGIELRDSLMLAQRSLDKWSEDMEVEHKKAVGKWNYNKFRTQKTKYSADELEYIEHDTLAGVECIDKTMAMINKRIFSIPYTSTGIIRDLLYKIAKEYGAKDLFDRIAPTYDQYIKLTKLFHGGYVHANRFLIDLLITAEEFGLISCFDFSSSYPFCMLAYKYPMERFTKMRDCSIDEILQSSEGTAFMFKLIGIGAELKNPDHPTPALQYSKCVQGTCINPVLDNGRIISADYFEIYLNEIDLEVINDQYKFKGAVCVEVEAAAKDYLPRWFTDFVFDLYKEKCRLSLTDDAVAYILQKFKINGCYGMSVQKSIKVLIKEVYETYTDDEGYVHESGDYEIESYKDEATRIKEEKKEYSKFLKKKSKILNYAWGCWVTSYAFRNIHELNKCVKPESEGGMIYYNDTDSCYASGWDLEKVKAYNDNCLKLLQANGYDAVKIGDRTFILGIAEHKPEKDDYTEFKIIGAKRYAGRCRADNKLHTTVAGVPKKTGALTLQDDLNNFTTGHIFKGKDTGKKMHVYFNQEMYVDPEGNETADSIDLLPADYLLDATEKFEHADISTEDIINDMFEEELEIYAVDENDI